MSGCRFRMLAAIVISGIVIFSIGYGIASYQNALEEDKVTASDTIEYRTFSHLDLFGYADKTLVCQTSDHTATVKIESQDYDSYPVISINGSHYAKGHMSGQHWFDKAEFSFYVDSYYDSGLLTDKYSVRFEMFDQSPSKDRCYLEIKSFHGNSEFVHEYGKIILQAKNELSPILEHKKQ